LYGENDMTKRVDSFNDPNTLFGRLRSSCPHEWDAFCNHEFVRRIGDATLPEACFRHYLLQDYLFLIHFSRAWALAVYKADTLADMRVAASVLNDQLNREMDLHLRYCAGWGITEQDMEQIDEARANMAYTRYVLDRGLAGDVLDLHVALAPCVIGYAVVGSHLVGHPKTKLEGNPYKDWIDMYAGEAYQKGAREALNHLDRLAASRRGQDRFESLVKTFRQATSLEVGFWEMGLTLQS
jgi:thiaminase/transcriptional activator TenA